MTNIDSASNEQQDVENETDSLIADYQNISDHEEKKENDRRSILIWRYVYRWMSSSTFQKCKSQD